MPLGSGNRWVADAGFDAFIRSRWEALRTGEAVELEFLAITRASFVAFVTREVSHDDEAVTFEVKALNPLIRLFVNPIRVTYDLRTRQLLRYAGLTDIALLDSSGKPAGNFSAEIRYHYHECLGRLASGSTMPAGLDDGFKMRHHIRVKLAVKSLVQHFHGFDV